MMIFSERSHNNRKVAALVILMACVAVVESNGPWTPFVMCPDLSVNEPSVQYYIPPDECFASPFDTGFQMKQCNTSWGTCVGTATTCDEINTCVRTLTYCLSTITLPTDTTPTGCTLWSAQWSVSRTSETGNAYTFSVREDACKYANCAYNEAAKRADINGGARCASQSAVCNTEPTATTPQPAPAPGATTPPPTTTPAPGSVTTDPPTVPLPPGVTVPATTTDPSGTGLPPGVTTSPGATLPPLPSTISEWPSHDNDKFRIVGRTATKSVLDGSTVKDAVAFDFSGVSISFLVSGASFVTIDLAWKRMTEDGESTPHRFVVEVNGTLTTQSPNNVSIYTKSSPVTPANSAPKPITYPVPLSANETWLPDANEWYLVTVTHVTEPDCGTLFGNEGKASAPVENWLAYGSVNVTGEDPKFHSIAPEPETRRVEFIGDSITAGYCNMCNEVPEIFGSPELRENFYYSWASRTCRGLNATCHTSAWSGIGMYRNFNGYNETTMREVYQRSLATDPESRWNFTDFKPAAVVINLGTNDMFGGWPWHRNESTSTYWPYVADDYIETYMEFVRNVSKHYGNDTELFLACGPMPWDYTNNADIPFCYQVKEVVKRVNDEGIARANFLEFQLAPCFRSSTYCCMHPSSEGDEYMASWATTSIIPKMNWTGTGVPWKTPVVCPKPKYMLFFELDETLPAAPPLDPGLVRCENVNRRNISDRVKALYAPPQACIAKHPAMKLCVDTRTNCTNVENTCGEKTACQSAFVACMNALIDPNVTECQSWHQDFDEAQTFINVGASFSDSILELSCEHMLCNSDLIPTNCSVNSTRICQPRVEAPVVAKEPPRSCSDQTDLTPGEPTRLLFPPYQCYADVGQYQLPQNESWTTIGNCFASHAFCISEGEIGGPTHRSSESSMNCTHEMRCANTYYRCVVDTVRRLNYSTVTEFAICEGWLQNITAAVKSVDNGSVPFEGSLLQRSCRHSLCTMRASAYQYAYSSGSLITTLADKCGPEATFTKNTSGSFVDQLHSFQVCQPPAGPAGGVLVVSPTTEELAEMLGQSSDFIDEKMQARRNPKDPVAYGAFVDAFGPFSVSEWYFSNLRQLFFPFTSGSKVITDNGVQLIQFDASCGLSPSWFALLLTVLLALMTGAT